MHSCAYQNKMKEKQSITGKDIKNAIKGAGYTMETAAEMLKITRQTLHNYLGKAEIDNDFLQNVKDVLQIDIRPFHKEPETYGEFIELYRKLVKQLEERVEVQDKYIALLEANAAKIKTS